MSIDRFSVFSTWGLISLIGMVTAFAIFSAPGKVCNYSSEAVWITVNVGHKRLTGQLRSGQCTKYPDQDAEVIWGTFCKQEVCRLQGWRVGTGVFQLYDAPHIREPPYKALYFRGWGLMSGWDYSLRSLQKNFQRVGYTLQAR